MRHPNRNYESLDGRSGEREAIQWYWRLLAHASSWMILSGFLILGPLFDRDPDLRVDGAVISVLAVALLTAGFSFTVLLCFACRDLRFQVEAVFTPCMGASVVAFLSIVLRFAFSTRYHWASAAIIGVSLSAVSAGVYGFLFVFNQRKLNSIGRTSHTPSTPHTNYWQKWSGFGSRDDNRNNPTGYYNRPQQNNYYPFDASHPQAGTFTYASGETVQAIPMPNPYSETPEEEMTRQQMLTLLLKPTNESSARQNNFNSIAAINTNTVVPPSSHHTNVTTPSSVRTTYHIDLPSAHNRGNRSLRGSVSQGLGAGRARVANDSWDEGDEAELLAMPSRARGDTITRSRAESLATGSDGGDRRGSAGDDEGAAGDGDTGHPDGGLELLSNARYVPRPRDSQQREDRRRRIEGAGY